MHIDQLEAFIYISLTGSFSKAGEILFLSQPSISSKIKVLEKELGTTLFERIGTKIYLTEEGESFLPYAQEALKNIHQGKLSLQNLNHDLDGEVHLSVVFSGTNYFLPNIIKEFNQLFPKIKLIVYSGHSNQVLNMILNHDAKLGIIRSIFHPQIESIRLQKDEIILVFHPEHPLSQRQRISIKDLAHMPLILFKRETLDWILINNAITKAISSPNIVMEIDSIEGAKQMVQNNIGVSFLPRFCIKEELQKGSLLTIPLTDIPKIQRSFELIFRKGETFDHLTQLFFNFIVQKFEHTS